MPLREKPHLYWDKELKEWLYERGEYCIDMNCEDWCTKQDERWTPIQEKEDD